MLAKSAFLCEGGRSGETQTAVLTRSRKRKKKKERKKKGRRMRQMGQNYKGKLKKRSLGTEKDVKVIKKNKTNNKIR